ncbi:hypothetical protein M0813_04857 [Anaeramoeba flamelloides]|uniref:Uncharacterized protein n=1 Tax=Anaeramoeba flamelloides TaxID=1746091 RepID=A0ABQ8XIP8_9EUKA|nr:hypothetical protein M0813_04857 [Anaeramoeba flamelloides]
MTSIKEFESKWHKNCPICNYECTSECCSKLKILETKLCNNKSQNCKYCQGSGIVYIVAQNKIPNKKTKPIQYYFNDNKNDCMIRFCKCKYKIKDCKLCKGTGIFLISMDNKKYYLREYDSPKRIKCKKCKGKNCLKCRGYGFTSVKLEKGLTIETKQKYQRKTIQEAGLCQSCLRSLNVGDCKLCWGYGRILKNQQICGHCSGYGCVVKHFYKYYKYKKCKNCQGMGIPIKSFLDLNLEECKNVIRRVLQFKQLLFDMKLNYKLKMNGQLQEFLYADAIMIDKSILNSSCYPLVFMTLKNSFTSLRTLGEHIRDHIFKSSPNRDQLQILKLYIAKKFTNWSHHLTTTKEQSGIVINENDLLSSLDFYEDRIKKSYSIENNEIPIFCNIKTKKKKQSKWTKSNLNKVDSNLNRFLINKIDQNKFENNNFHRYLLFSKN